MSANEKYYNVVSNSSGFSFPSSTSETTILTITPSQNMQFEGIFLDLNALTQDATIKSKYDINNNSNYITCENIFFDASGSNKAIIIGKKFPGNNSIRITIQSGTVEGVTRNIPYEYFYTDLGDMDA